MKNTKATKKLNKKGFSLIELIIVVAIMAVLIGVLAPQYLRYVERSRESSDLDNYEVIISALEVYAADSTVTTPLVDGSTITFPINAAPTASSTVITDALTASGITLDHTRMRSARYSHECTVTGVIGTNNAQLTINVNNGIMTVTTNNIDLNAALGR